MPRANRKVFKVEFVGGKMSKAQETRITKAIHQAVLDQLAQPESRSATDWAVKRITGGIVATQRGIER